MAYPEDLLGEDEYVVVHRHPHWKMLVGPVLVFFVVVGGGFYLAALVAQWEWHLPVWITLAVVGAVLTLWLTVPPLLRWRTTHVVVTTRRLMVREGVFTRTGVDIPMSRIDSVRYGRGIMDRIFGSGTLIVESASDEPLEFDDVPGVEQVSLLLYRQISDNTDDGAADGGYESGRGDRVEHDEHEGRA